MQLPNIELDGKVINLEDMPEHVKALFGMLQQAHTDVDNLNLAVLKATVWRDHVGTEFRNACTKVFEDVVAPEAPVEE